MTLPAGHQTNSELKEASHCLTSPSPVPAVVTMTRRCLSVPAACQSGPAGHPRFSDSDDGPFSLRAFVKKSEQRVGGRLDDPAETADLLLPYRGCQRSALHGRPPNFRRFFSAPVKTLQFHFYCISWISSVDRSVFLHYLHVQIATLSKTRITSYCYVLLLK